MMASVYSDSVKYIAAVDIGETYSGCALLDMTKKNDTGQNVTNIVWEKSLSQCRAKKTRTCILFNECGNVAEFGYDAEKKFKELLGLGKAQEWYFFQNYKHCLNEPQIPEEITDIYGKCMPFEKVVRETLRYLTSKVTNHIGQSNDYIPPLIIQEHVEHPILPVGIDLQSLEGLLDIPNIGIHRNNLILDIEDSALSMTVMKYIKQSGNTCGWQNEETCILIDLGSSIKISEYKISTENNCEFETVFVESQKIENFDGSLLAESNGVFPTQRLSLQITEEIFSLHCRSEKTICERSLVNQIHSLEPKPLRVIAKCDLFFVFAKKIRKRSQITKTKARVLLLCGGHSEDQLFANAIVRYLSTLSSNEEKLDIHNLQEGSLAVLEGAILLARSKIKLRPKSKYLMAAAIDIGTAYSGYVFSIVSDFLLDPMKTFSYDWVDVYNGGITSKTSSCILFTPDELFFAFGYDAERQYYEDLDDDDREEWLFFDLFKMKLYESEDLNSLFLESKCGKRLKAKTIFTEVVRYMMTSLMNLCSTRLGSSIHKNEIKWIITVPAIWSNSAKSFMREAAVEAGIESEDLIIALEPEAAAVFVQHLPLNKSVDEKALQRFPRGLKYLVLDAGGGTVDITAHEVLDDCGHVKEIISPTGGPWGGSNVDSEFLRFLFTVLEWTDTCLEMKYEDAIFEARKKFENKKRLIDPKKQGKVTIDLPHPFIKIIQKIYKLKDNQSKENCIKVMFGTENIEFSIVKHKIRLESKATEIFFQPSINGICEHLKSLFQKERALGIDTILMVGGYSSSPVLQNAVRSMFPSKRVIIPVDSMWSILRGAVIFGHDPTFIKQRKSKYTYGVACSEVFNPAIHEEKYKFTKDGKVRCKSIFSKHVEIDEDLQVGEYQSDISYAILSDYDFSLSVYATKSPNPMYVTDTGCKLIGSLSLKDQVADTNSFIRVQMSFSDTEIKVKLEYVKTAKSTVEKYLQP